jgi:hypothetical protein
MKKTAVIKITTTTEIKSKLLEKSKEMNLTITGFIEKVSLEPIAFLDKNVISIFKILNLQSNNKK